ncbi:hypothetical protein GXW84_33820 [Rhodococcus sp. IEGM 248]|nr:hypothetical protein [Rhodococcus sp. IEGM 248]
MVEQLRTGYTRLFEVRVMHHFWLDEGATAFSDLAPERQQRRLSDYDVRRILEIRPDTATAATIARLRGVFRSTSVGFLVAVPDTAHVLLDAEFGFSATAVDPHYADYTALTLRPQRTVDVVEPGDPEVVHRFKQNVPVLSNLTGVARGSGASARLFLSQRIPSGAGDGIEALVVSGATLRQLTKDPPNPASRSLGPAVSHPVYVHQGDVPAITAPPGSTGAPARGVELAPDTPPDVMMIIRLSPRPPDDKLAFAEKDGAVRTPAPVFEVHLRNRSTLWRYHQRDGSVATEPGDPLPLSYAGNAGTKQKPSVGALDVDRMGEGITALYSDVRL